MPSAPRPTEPPFGRAAEVQRLRAARARVRASGRWGVVALVGPEGSGRSTLLDWAAEGDDGVRIRVEHGQPAGPEDGLGPAVRRALGGALGPANGPAGESAASLLSLAGLHPLRLPSPREEPWAELGRRMARTESLLAIDDAELAADAVAFARWLVADGPTNAGLVLVVVSSDAADGDLGWLLDRAERIHLTPPLAAPDATPIERALLGRSRLALAGLVERALDERAQPAVVALAIALGARFPAHSWREACDRAGLESPDAAAAHLVGAGLLRGAGDGWQWAHPAVRRWALAWAQSHGVLDAAHRLLADLHRARRMPVAALQAAEHEAQLGPLRAAQVLMDDVDAWLLPGGLTVAEALLNRREQALAGAGVPLDHPAWPTGWLRAARVAQLRGNLDAARALHQRAAEAVAGSDHKGLRVPLLTLDGDLAHAAGAVARALALYDAAAALVEPGLDAAVAARVSLGRGQALMRLARFADAREALTDCIRLGSDAHALALCVDARNRLARLELNAGDATAALVAVQRARTDALAARDRLGLADCEQAWGDIERARGRLDDAEQHYRTAIVGYRELGSGAVLTTTAGLGMTLAAQGRHDDALALFRELQRNLEHQGRASWLDAAAALTLWPLAALGDLPGLDDALRLAMRCARAGGVVDQDLGEAAERAARALMGLPEVGPAALGRAARMAELALYQWRTLGRDERAGAVVALLDALSQQGAPAPLGAFQLVRPVGKGAMGEVWRATFHGPGGVVVPAAIKVLNAGLAQAPAVHKLMLAEARAVADLDHPHVALLLDVGTVGPAAPLLTAERIAEGTPFLAMELAHGGTLEGALPAPNWAAARSVLLSLLDALAHAHARGRIHRDLKPANVLASHPDDLRPGVKLTDFGLAHAIGEAGAKTVAGTPRYMSPEQFRGAWRDFGPWTDLYALGCIAGELVSGRPLFAGHDFVSLREAHLEGRQRPLELAFAVPDGFDGWLQAMVCRAATRRFACAADAAVALVRLGDPQQERTQAPDLRSSDLRTLDTLLMHDLGATTGVGGDIAAPADAQNAGPGGAPSTLADEGEQLPPIAPFPGGWRGVRPRRLPTALVGAGLGLWGLRPVPLAGRDAERDALWQSLACVHAEGRARVVVVRGAAGLGKTRLCEWLLERAHELGAARVCAHQGVSGLLPLVVAMGNTRGLDAAAAGARFHQLLMLEGDGDPGLSARLARLLAAADGDAEGGGLPPAERYATVRELLHGRARQRPVIAFIDDAQHQADCLAFAHHLLDAQDVDPAAVLLVLAGRDDPSAEGAEGRPPWAGLLGRPGVGSIELAPLDRVACRTLVADMLGLEGDLARQVELRSGGNPHFAVQLVGDWIEQGLLVAGDEGFRLASDRAPPLPQGLYTLWSGRVDRLLSGLAQPARTALELLCLLGPEVEQAAWDQACRRMEVLPPPALVERLTDERLCRVDGSRLVLLHGLLAECVERRAREAGRLTPLHQACAAVLAASGHPSAMARRGRHLSAAGDFDEAADVLLDAAAAWFAESDFQSCADALTAWEEAMRRGGQSEGDPRWGRGGLVRVKAQLELGAAPLVVDAAAALARQARAAGWHGVRTEAILVEADALRQTGQLDRAEARFNAGLAEAQKRGARALVGRHRHGLGLVARARGQFSRAATLLEEALLDHAAAADLINEAASLFALGGIRLRSGDMLGGLRAYLRAQAIYEDAGDRLGLAMCANGLGEVARLGGDPDEAERRYTEALKTFVALGSGRAVYPRINLAIGLLDRDRLDEARAALEQLALTLEKQGLRGLLGAAHVLLLVTVAAAPSSEAWDHHLHCALTLLAEADSAEPDTARAAERAARLAERGGLLRRAADAWRLAADQWSGAGREDQAAQASHEVGRLLGRLDWTWDG